MKKNENDFADSVQSFFQNYLIKECGVSTHTIRSYKQTFILLLDYYSRVMNIKTENLSIGDLSRASISNFLTWLEQENKSCATTRNQRFSAICSYCRYMLHVDPIHMSTWKDILSIRIKKHDTQTINHMSMDAVVYLLNQVDVQTKKGRRNLALLSFLYNTGARVQELIDLTPRCLHMDRPSFVEIMGKGRKKRIVPLDNEILELLRRYLMENNLLQIAKLDTPLFYNSRGEKLSPKGIYYIIDKYVMVAKEKHPEYYSFNITPHVFRHTRAMHLLDAGVNLVYIRDFLGHSSVQTTEIYAKANLKHVTSALETAYDKIGISTPKLNSWEKDESLKNWLKEFGK